MIVNVKRKKGQTFNNEVPINRMGAFYRVEQLRIEKHLWK